MQWFEKFTDVDEVIPVSAKYGHGVEDVKDWILSKLPVGPAYYPKVCLKLRIKVPVSCCFCDFYFPPKRNEHCSSFTAIFSMTLSVLDGRNPMFEISCTI